MAHFWWQSVLPPVPKNTSNACACALVLVSQFWVVPPPEGEFLMQPVHQTASYIQTGENVQTKLESFKEQVSTHCCVLTGSLFVQHTYMTPASGNLLNPKRIKLQIDSGKSSETKDQWKESQLLISLLGYYLVIQQTFTYCLQFDIARYSESS